MNNPDIAALAESISPNALRVILALSDEFQPAPRQYSRQLTASAASRHGKFIESEWQGGCAQCTYYRLTPIGLALRAHLRAQANAK